MRALDFKQSGCKAFWLWISSRKVFRLRSTKTVSLILTSVLTICAFAYGAHQDPAPPLLTGVFRWQGDFQIQKRIHSTFVRTGTSTGQDHLDLLLTQGYLCYPFPDDRFLCEIQAGFESHQSAVLEEVKQKFFNHRVTLFEPFGWRLNVNDGITLQWSVEQKIQIESAHEVTTFSECDYTQNGLHQTLSPGGVMQENSLNYRISGETLETDHEVTSVNPDGSFDTYSVRVPLHATAEVP